MLERLLEFRTVLNALSSNVYEVRDESGTKMRNKIENLNFDKIKIIVAALKPIAELTHQLSLRDSSAAEILPIYCMFTSRWSESNLDEDNEVDHIRSKITAGLVKRMDKMQSDK